VNAPARTVCTDLIVVFGSATALSRSHAVEAERV
jgi:hypothetical protein